MKTNRVSKGFALLAVILALGIGAFPAFSESPQSSAPTVTVYKTPKCGCCAKWVDHLKKNGFQATVNNLPDLTLVKAKYGVPKVLGSCHTAIVDGYVVEGHVPADVIQKLLTERPNVVGIAVPDMPIGSPGMEGDYNEPYDVLTFDKDGKTTVYTSR